MISYCIACYRPVYARLLIDDLIRKTSAPYEILAWINTVDAEFDRFLEERIASGVPVRIIGQSRENIGMAAYPRLFQSSSFDLVVQIDDDVVCVGPGIAEAARAAFDRFPSVGMLASDVWQDEYTTGARPPLEHYRLFDEEFGLYDGPIDGWFAVYRKETIQACRDIHPGRYYGIGNAILRRLRSMGRYGLLSKRMKVFHVTGPYYASYFGMLDSEIAKYRSIGREDMVNWYQADRHRIPAWQKLHTRVEDIRASLEPNIFRPLDTDGPRASRGRIGGQPTMG
jgi:Glycosyltransferase like family 2